MRTKLSAKKNGLPAGEAIVFWVGFLRISFFNESIRYTFSFSFSACLAAIIFCVTNGGAS
jgi:hypothetical protein